MMRLSPLDPHIFRAQAGIAAAHLVAGRFEEAASGPIARDGPTRSTGRRCAWRPPRSPWMARLEEARRVMADLLANDPGLPASATCGSGRRGARRPSVSWPKGLRLAGLPE